MPEVQEAPLNEVGNDNGAREMTRREKIEAIVSYHKPSEEGVAKIGKIREATANLIEVIVANCPKTADRSAAIRKAREAMMTANAAIVVPEIYLG